MRQNINYLFVALASGLAALGVSKATGNSDAEWWALTVVGGAHLAHRAFIWVINNVEFH